MIQFFREGLKRVYQVISDTSARQKVGKHDGAAHGA